VGYITHHPSVCEDLECRPGRECLSVGGRPTCVCRQHCPDHWKPVCGSDGVSYDSHCELHKAACDSNTHITPRHRRFCSGDRAAIIARQEFISELSHLDESSSSKVPLPDACFENDRNRLREFLMSWFLISAKKQSWYSAGMSRGEELWGHFYSADLNKDLAMDTGELMEYINRNKTGTGKHQQENNKMRHLCVEALIEEGDQDEDESLNFTEFRRIMGARFRPSRQVCTADGRKYADGAERTVECNGCVCAHGKWICTAEMCVEGFRDVEENSSEYDNESVEISDDDPEDDPDVQDIRWF